MKPILSFLGIIGLGLAAMGQPAVSWTEKAVWPESPQAATIREVTSPAPALLTGAAEFSVPLHTLSAEGLDLDFSFNYRSNGVRVDDEPCPWGYGWTLSPCVRISRRIMGRPDGFCASAADFDDGLFTHTMCFLCITDSATSHTNPGLYDPAPDIFTVQLPGKQFSFMRIDGKFITAGCDEYRITADPRFEAITVTDPQGFIYNFDIKGEYVKTPDWCTEWLPSEITCPSGRKIQFSYVECFRGHVKNQQTFNGPSFSYEYQYPPYKEDWVQNITYLHPNFYGGYHLKSVAYMDEWVEVSYATGANADSRILSSVKVHVGPKTTKQFSFTYNQEKNLPLSIQTPEGLYRFDYNKIRNPAPYPGDWWGFHNHDGKTAKPSFSLEICGFKNSNGNVPLSFGPDREISEEIMKDGMLVGATYPTGAKVKWEYETHCFDTPLSDSNIGYPIRYKNETYSGDFPLTKGGGLRVRSIALYNGPDDSSPRITEYVYGPDGNGKAVCSRVPNLESFVDIREYYDYRPPNTGSWGKKVKRKVVSLIAQSRYMDGIIGEMPIWYSQIEERTTEGKTVYCFDKFVGDDDRCGLVPSSYAPLEVCSAFSDGPQMTKKTVYALKDGSPGEYIPVSTEVMDYAQAVGRYCQGYTIGRIYNCTVGSNAPDFTGKDNMDLEGGHTGVVDFTHSIITFETEPVYVHRLFKIYPVRDLLCEKTVTEHTENGDITRKEEYSYVDGTELLKKQSQLSATQKMHRELRYPSATASSAVERAMVAANVVGVSIGETVTYANDSSVTTDAVMEQKRGTAVFRPTSVQCRRGSGPAMYAPVYTWDEIGNQLSVTDGAGVRTEYAWDDTYKRYPVKMTVGGTLSTMAQWQTGIGVCMLTTPFGSTHRYSYDKANRLICDSIDGHGTVQTWEYSIDANGADNYVKSTTWMSASGKDNPYSIVRYDALGRPSVELSALKTDAGWNYSASATTYDAMGRPSRSFAAAPVKSDSPSAADVASAASAFYSDSEPFAESFYEASQRRLAVGSAKAGIAWHKSGRRATVRRLTNTTAKPYKCAKFKVVPGGFNQVIGWRAGELSVTETTDEDGITVTEFTDMFGRCVMRRKGEAETYYVYNEYGDLCYVLPPGLKAEGMKTDNTQLNALGFIYAYDARGRLISKKWPGRPASHFRYDTANRLVAENDADLGDSWRLHFYDYAGREVLVIETVASPDAISGLLDAAPAKLGGSGKYAGYDLPVALPADAEILYAWYYDNYAFLNSVPDKADYALSAAGSAGGYLASPLSLRTGCYTGAAGGYEVYYYDRLGREIERVGSGYEAGRLSRSYNYAGQVVRECQDFPAELGLPERVITTSYDSGGRPVAVDIDMKSTIPGRGIARFTYSYDAIGRLTGTGLGAASRRVDYDIHGWPTRLSTAYPMGLGKQTADSIVERLHYADGTLPRYNGFISSRELAGARYDYSYDAMGRLTEAAFTPPDGIIGESPDFSTAYEYDLRGNIISLSRHGVVDRVPFGLKSTMDSYGLLDDLSISYDGNMISSVHSAGTKAATFAGRAGAALREGDYDLRWDEAARLKYDETRSIVDISYNSLGQPASMRHSWGDLQTYTYDGLGRRTEANYHTVRNATDHRRRYHASGLVTCNDTIETLRFPGGYFDRALQAHYYVTDYQGNNIAVLPHQFEARPEQSMSYYPYGEPHRRPTASGSPSASTQNRYLFADKEYTDFGGESHSDFGPRTLNLPIPFFATQDILCEKRPDESPYIFCAANPVHLIDPTGEEPTSYEAALMAQAVYEKDLSNENLHKDLNGWKLSSFNTSITKNLTKWYQNGLQSALFERTIDDKTEYAYVFAGTNSLEDGLEDFAQLIGLSPQYATAIENAKTLASELEDSELTFIGHSLGGGEAAAASMATGKNAITFNAAAVSSLTKQFYNLSNDENITNYRMIPPGFGSIRVGGCIISNLQDKFGMNAAGNTIKIPTSDNNPFTAHGIINFVNYFSK